MTEGSAGKQHFHRNLHFLGFGCSIVPSNPIRENYRAAAGDMAMVLSNPIRENYRCKKPEISTLLQIEYLAILVVLGKLTSSKSLFLCDQM